MKQGKARERTDLLRARCQCLWNRTQLEGGECYGGAGWSTNQRILTTEIGQPRRIEKVQMSEAKKREKKTW